VSQWCKAVPGLARSTRLRKMPRGLPFVWNKTRRNSLVGRPSALKNSRARTARPSNSYSGGPVRREIRAPGAATPPWRRPGPRPLVGEFQAQRKQTSWPRPRLQRPGAGAVNAPHQQGTPNRVCRFARKETARPRLSDSQSPNWMNRNTTVPPHQIRQRSDPAAPAIHARRNLASARSPPGDHVRRAQKMAKLFNSLTRLRKFPIAFV
jgi:hypothetical protein